MWQPILKAPLALELQLAVLDDEGVHALVFPCRKTLPDAEKRWSPGNHA
jgi:hypothetical protein